MNVCIYKERQNREHVQLHGAKLFSEKERKIDEFLRNCLIVIENVTIHVTRPACNLPFLKSLKFDICLYNSI